MTKIRRGFQKIEPISAPPENKGFGIKKPSLILPKGVQSTEPEPELPEDLDLSAMGKPDPKAVPEQFARAFPPLSMPPWRSDQNPSVKCPETSGDELVDINPFPYLFKAKYDFNFESIQEKIETDIKRSKRLVQENGISTPEKDGGTTTVLLVGSEINGERYTSPHEWPELEHFVNEWIPANIKKIWKAWNFCSMSVPYISESWVNEHPYASFTEGHTHRRSQISLSCYLKVPEDSGRFMVRNPMDAYTYSQPVAYDYHPTGQEWRYIDVEDGDVLFFPGYLHHMTERSLSKENRYIMSINISSLDINTPQGFEKGVYKPMWVPD